MPTCCWSGSSPRGRGTGERLVAHIGVKRFIPAWAGNRIQPHSRNIAAAVHPRVGGEQDPHLCAVQHRHGSSPRGRGTDSGGNVCRIRRRFIPAWAGNSPFSSPLQISRPVHPRVGGEQLAHICLADRLTGSSPRGRGTVRAIIHQPFDDRFIPAWAGNSCSSFPTIGPSPVHPRVGGEQATPDRLSRPIRGSSPRGRGTAAAIRERHLHRRFIPAWAGNSSARRCRLAERAVHPRVGAKGCTHRQV